MKYGSKLFLLYIILLCTTPPPQAWSATTTIVGNGDDGKDLEGTTLVTSGPLEKARQGALTLSESLNIAGIAGLGTLVPELRVSSIYEASADVAATADDRTSPFHASMTGQVYARTFAQAHAATRFFPISKSLSPTQLVALHIHEALHRALPASIREDEDAVTKLTLAITAPEASHDRVRQVASSVIPLEPTQSPMTVTGSATGAASGVNAYRISDSRLTLEAVPERFQQPSSVGYTYRYFHGVDLNRGQRLTSMHLIGTQLYPFGDLTMPIGLGIETALIRLNNTTQMGPLRISPRIRLWTIRGFDLGLWGTASLNTLSAEELKQSRYGRDVVTVGLSLDREKGFLYIKNNLSWSSKGTTASTVGSIDYKYSYGETIEASIHAGALYRGFRLGGYGQLHLADYFKVEGGAFSMDTGRYRIFSAGPELAFIQPQYEISLGGRFMVNSTNGTDLTYLGNIMGAGVAQGCVEGSVRFFL